MLAGLFLATGLVLSSLLASSTWLRVRNSQFVTVKGSVQTNVESDLVVWSGSYEIEAATLLDAQRAIQTDRSEVENFLKAAGITNTLFAPVGIEEEKASKKTEDGWTAERTTG